MGSSKKQTVGYWYHPTFLLAACRGPVDALLKLRGADVDAWTGELTASGTISINRPGLWGGESAEGGIRGSMDVMFGAADQVANPAGAAIGTDPSAHRGLLTLLWRGGRWGAMNPYPKPVSLMLRRILQGWDDGCWYPEKAPVPLIAWGDSAAVALAFNYTGADQFYTVLDGMTSLPFRAWGGGGGAGRRRSGASEGGSAGEITVATEGGGAGYVEGVIDVTPGDVITLRVGGGAISPVSVPAEPRPNYLDGHTGGWPNGGDGGQRDNGAKGGGGGGPSSLLRSGVPLAIAPGGGGGGSDYSDGYPGGGLDGDGATHTSSTDGELGGGGGTQVDGGTQGNNGPAGNINERGRPGDFNDPGDGGAGAEGTAGGSGGSPYAAGGGGGGGYHGGGGGGASQDEGTDGGGGGGSALVPPGGSTSAGIGRVPGQPYSAAVGYGGDAADPSGRDGLIVLTVPQELVAMNPAHIVYYSLISENMQGEPAVLVNEASFTAAADLFYAEGLGLCTTWDPDQETIEAFRQRICEAVGARCSRSTVDGQWYLDVMRGQYDLEALPVLNDDDILDFEAEPAVLDDAVNQVAVQWFDPLTKQERTTAPLHALGAIDGNAVNAQTLAYSCLPTEALALRTAARELRARATPLWRYKLTTNRRPYSWRTGTYFRLQAPKRGVADMVCLVGDIEKGTLRSGAISLTAVQDVYGMPSTTYVEEQTPIEPPSTTPVALTEQRAIEAPYVEMAGRLSAVELGALASDAGFLLTIGARPGVGINYELHTRPGAGDYEAAGIFDWCPIATIVEAAARADTAFTTTGGVLLDRVVVGTAALWGDEIVRVDALDSEAGTITLARGCADTVPAEHAAGERIWFYDSWSGLDQIEYVDGETVNAKLLTRTGTEILSIEVASALSLTLDSRAARPLPPGGLQINGNSWPSAAVAPIAVTWAHRDRVLQADQLVDTTEASIGPEAGTTYSLLLTRTDTEATLESATGVSGTSHTFSSTYSGEVRLQVWSVRDGLDSWQRQEHVFAHAGADGRVTEAGEIRVTEAGELREME